MAKKLDHRDWINKYQNAVQNENLINMVKKNNLPINDAGAWSFLKLAFLWSIAYYIYSPIIGSRYSNMCYVDLFSGSGLVKFKDVSNNYQLMMGSPLLTATIESAYPFNKCFFFEKNFKFANALEKRLNLLSENKKLSCESFKVINKDCNKAIDDFIKAVSKIPNTHFLLFVDPYSTEIHWRTMEKLLSSKYPAFDMIFNFQPFGVNRKRYMPEELPLFFGDTKYKKLIPHGLIENKVESILQKLEAHYTQKLIKYSDKIKTINPIRIRSGKGGYYYDLIFTTRKKLQESAWLQGIEHLKTMIEKSTGYEVSIILDPTRPSIEEFG